MRVQPALGGPQYPRSDRFPSSVRINSESGYYFSFVLMCASSFVCCGRYSWKRMWCLCVVHQSCAGVFCRGGRRNGSCIRVPRQHSTRGKVQTNAIGIGSPHWDVYVNRQSRGEVGTGALYPINERGAGCFQST